MVLTSGWPRLSGRIARADAVSGNDVTLEDIDTSNSTRYPAGTGTGNVREVTTWTQIAQVLEFATSGGEQQFLTYEFLEEDVQRQIPTVKTPVGATLSIADDTDLPHYAVLAAADEDRQPRAIRIVLPSGDTIFYNAYVTLNKTPILTKNELMALQVTLSLVSEPTRYNA